MGTLAAVHDLTQWKWIALFALGLVAGLVLRVVLGLAANTPGHGDSAFYYTVAKNIVDGRGLVVDYVTYFFNGLVPLTHYAGDFWNPLAEILLSFPMLILGKSVFHAMLASFVAGLVPALVAFLVARKYAGSVSFAALAGVLTFFAPYEVWVSSLTEAIVFFGAFGCLALYFAIKGRQAPRYFLVAALCTGLAHLVRQDGVLLLVALAGCIVLAPLDLRRKAGILALVLGIHAIVVSPLYIRNFVEYRTPFPSGPSQTMYLTTYEDFHSYGKELDWKTLRATWGMRGLLTRRLHTAQENLNQIRYFMDPILFYLTPLAALNLVLRRRKTRDLWVYLPVLLFAILEFLFYTFIASFSGPGSLPKGLAIVLPFICILCLDGLEFYVRPQWLLALVVVGLSAYLGNRGYQGNYSSAVYYNGVYQQYGEVRKIVLADAARVETPPGDVVIMARNTWDVYEGTGFKSVMVPNNDLNTIYEVALHYDAGYLLLPAPRKALDDIYAGTTPDPRFKLLAGIPGTDWKIFKIQFPAR